MLKKVIEKIIRAIRNIHGWLAERLGARLLKDTPYNRGLVCMYEGNYKKAMRMFKKKVINDPEGILGWYMLGEAYWELGKAEEARRSYVKAWSYRRRIKERYEDDKEITQSIREALVRSGVVAEASDADAL
ncbi:MAG: hypothetical protein ABSH12_00370 [Endomicrobiales bacterium]|jgi:predicted Zn-dependent protease